MTVDLREFIREIPDFPEPGIIFRDITPLLLNPAAARQATEEMVDFGRRLDVDIVVAAEARGFILGGAIAQGLDAGFVPARKPGRLPAETVSVQYELEYGLDELEVHADAFAAGARVLIHDDLIATGGTMMAGRKLLERLGATVMEGAAIVDLPELGGSQKLRDSGLPLFTLVDFAGH